jgi:hypothetical protein
MNVISKKAMWGQVVSLVGAAVIVTAGGNNSPIADSAEAA